MSGFYAAAEAAGYGYGPAFRGLEAVWRRGEEVFAEVALPEGEREEAVRFGVHPALLDAALHANGFGSFGAGDDGVLRLPFAWTGVWLFAGGADRLRVRIAGAGEGALAVEAADGVGRPVARVESLVLRPVTAGALAGVDSGEGDALFRVVWSGIAVPEVSAEGVWAVLGGDERFGWVRRFRVRGWRSDAYPGMAGLRAVLDAGVPAPAVVLCAVGSGVGVGSSAVAGAAERATVGCWGRSGVAG